VTSVNISVCLLVTYFIACNHGYDVSSDGGLARTSSLLWQQPVMQFVTKKLLPSSCRDDARYLQQTFSLISRLFALNISAGMFSWKYPPFFSDFN